MFLHALLKVVYFLKNGPQSNIDYFYFVCKLFQIIIIGDVFNFAINPHYSI